MGTKTHSGTVRRRWSAEQKRRVVEDCLVPGAKVPEVARRHGVPANLVYAWRRQSQAESPPRSTLNEGRFVPVTIAQARRERSACVDPVDVGIMLEVVLRNGRMLRVPAHFDPARAVAFADALEGIRP